MDLQGEMVNFKCQVEEPLNVYLLPNRNCARYVIPLLQANSTMIDDPWHLLRPLERRVESNS